MIPSTSSDLSSDGAFQRLLRNLSALAKDRPDDASLLKAFCRAAREFFQVSGVYYWRSQSPDELIGEQAEGRLAEQFAGLRLRALDSAVMAQALSRRRTTFSNQMSGEAFPGAGEFPARALMAAPLIVKGEVIGLVTLLHDSEPDFFNEDLTTKVTILVGQLGSLLEAERQRPVAREGQGGAEILAGVAQVLSGNPDVSAVIEALADRLRILLRTRLVCVLTRGEGPFELRAVSAETPQLADTVRARHDRQTVRFASDLAQRAVAAGEPITLSIGAEAHALGDLISAGVLIAAPFRTSRTQGAILVYPRRESAFTADDKALVSAIAGFGAVAVAHAELYATAHGQARELHQLLEISCELSSSANLEHFLQAFVVRAGDFLGFGRSFIALFEEGQFRVRYGADKGESRRVDVVFPEGVATRKLRAKEVFWTDEASQIPGANLELIVQYAVRQFLAVPLLGAEGQLLGMFGVLDRPDGKAISQEDIRRARALANQAAVMLEVAHNLHRTEKRGRHTDAVIDFVSEIQGARGMSDFASRLVRSALEVTGCRAGALAVFQDGRFQIVADLLSPERGSDRLASASTKALPGDHEAGSRGLPHIAEPDEGRDRALDPRLEHQLSTALAELLARKKETVICGSATELVGAEVASKLGWVDCTVLRLSAEKGGLAGVLCLSGWSPSFREEDRAFLEAMTAHAAKAMERAQLFTRMERANQHWLEVFDAITDFIVVHDEADKVLRVNRSLASLVGVPPAELIGLHMRALLATARDVSPLACPFCRSSTDADEFVHPVFDRTYLVSTSRVQGAGGEGPQTIHVLKDISDRREAERRYRELFDNIQEGLFFSTPAGRFIEVNDAMVQMLGYSSRDELLQIDIPSQLYFSPEQRQHHARMMEEHGHLRNFEATLRRKDGSPIHVLINAFGLYDSGGRLTQIRGLMLDVTGLRTSQSELQRERDFSGKILNTTQSLILVSDTAGLISYANRRWHDVGFEQRELLGRPLLELAAPGYVRPLADALQSTLQGQAVDNLELQVMRRNGIAGQFSANLSPMRDEQGNVTSMVVVLTDITDSAVLRDKLVHAEKMAAVGQLVSGVAHEVNNPLTAILGFADLLMENPDLPETARKDLRVILQEAQRTKQIVQNLLSFARQMPPQRTAVQLNTILLRTVQLRSYDFTSHGVEVIKHLDEQLPEVMGDAHQLQQVFLNILNNAYDAVHEVGRPGRIEIMTTKAGDAVEVSFSDNGGGIAHPDKIFDPFFTTKEVGKGTGLGLSICYGIVKEHGGEILCHNNTHGPGATFVVRLPATSHSASKGMAAGVLQK